MKDLGELSYYLGMRVVKTDTCTKILQDAYLEKVIERFNLENANPVDTPGAPGQQLTADDCPTTAAGKLEMSKKPFRSLVSSLMFAYVGTRPDIGSALTRVAAFCENPGGVHWVAAKRVLRYLLGTTKDAITYAGVLTPGEKVRITVYCDSDWAQDKDDRKSTSGYVVLIAGGPVSWKTKKQPTRAMSSCEAEFISLSEATKELIWFTHFLTELGIDFETPVIYTDSQSAMDWTKNACHHQRTKHVALKYFFVRDIVADKVVKIAYVCTKDNIADVLTKSVTRSIFGYLKPKLMGLFRQVGKGVR